MGEPLSAAVIIGGVVINGVGIVFAVLSLILAACALFFFWYYEIRKTPELNRFKENPLLSPGMNDWESEAVFNPAAVVYDGKVHLLYRALGRDGISRIGYASSNDGIHFERYPNPVYESQKERPEDIIIPTGNRLSYETLTYNRDIHASGGGWGGSEDPRAVIIEDRVYMNFSMFEGWHSIRVSLTSLTTKNLRDKKWKWSKRIPISPQNETHKNWVLFPEKIHGRFAIIHALSPTIHIEYIDSIDKLEQKPIRSNNSRSGRKGAWDSFVRGAAAPPIKTTEGWLLLYHAMDENNPHVGYKLGAMLLDLENPTTIRFRSSVPILEPEQWYENDWKPGVVYATGAVVFGDDLFVYYGGGDKHIAAARANMREFLRRLTSYQHASLTPVRR